MCCFSAVTPPIDSWFARLWGPRLPDPGQPLDVEETRIFARVAGTEQYLAYSMTLSVSGEVAMILPLPVRPGSGDEALSFLNLKRYAKFFDDMAKAFVYPVEAYAGAREALAVSVGPRLAVHSVGDFEASFVPSPRDFERLDPRFRMPAGVWDRIPAYADYGFAVFRLKPGRSQHVHPMAFRFQTRDPTRLFFPTLHVHDGQVHERAAFAHKLYFQGVSSSMSGEPSVAALGKFVKARKAAGLIDPQAPARLRRMQGNYKNEDTWVAGVRASDPTPVQEDPFSLSDE